MKELPKTYSAKETDSKWYRFWEEGGFFKADPASDKPSYCVVMPPPNVTGMLHMGHALVSTLQDTLVRWKRMSGYETLWVPGTDHAGIATQTVVERHLMASQKKRRSDFSREDFLDIVWSWKEENEKRILSQLKMMGCSCDWSALRFTMDEGCSAAVRRIFKKLYTDGLIYRGDYLVNWDPLTQTALADDEVEYEDRDSSLWTFKFPLADGTGFVHVATTRPETALGDTAIAIAPHDDRYKHLIGKFVRHPLNGREIPIIVDHHVDPAFGTGMVKVTPAHDPNDYRMGRDHNLPLINILTPDGKINENGAPFTGMGREEARKAVVEKLQSLGLVEKIEPHKLRVGVSYRSKAVLEPYLSKQWFVKVAPFVEKLKDAVQSGKVKLIPGTWEHTYFHWVNNLRDWCISRQLWWGHRIPIWYHKENPDKIICFDGVGLPPEVAAEPEKWRQDEDVLDTWFSSALWPFSTLGWPDNTPLLKKFYPNSTLITGHDILFFWVARMLMMGEYAMGEFPFPETYLHGLIYGKSYWRKNSEGGITYIGGEERRQYDLGHPTPADVHSKWEKLSKSKGNAIDPLELIEEYGTDAVRMTLCASPSSLPQIDLDRRRFEEFKNFANKVWNGARFVFMNLEGLTSEEFSRGLNETILKLEDRWILSTLNRVTQKVNEALGNYAFDHSAISAYDFFWKEFCAYYVEISKPVLFGKAGTPEEKVNKQKILTIVLCNAIRLMHPMAPFITEELFQHLKELLPNLHAAADPYTQESVQALLSAACMASPYPKVIREKDISPAIEEAFCTTEKIVYTIRNIRGEMSIPPHLPTDIYLIGEIPEGSLPIISALVKAGKIEVTKTPPALGFSSTGIVGALKILIPLPKELEQKERERLVKEKERHEKSLERLRAQLANEDFLAKAKPELIQKQRELLIVSEQELKAIEEKLSG